MPDPRPRRAASERVLATILHDDNWLQIQAARDIYGSNLARRYLGDPGAFWLTAVDQYSVFWLTLQNAQRSRRKNRSRINSDLLARYADLCARAKHLMAIRYVRPRDHAMPEIFTPLEMRVAAIVKAGNLGLAPRLQLLLTAPEAPSTWFIMPELRLIHFALLCILAHVRELDLAFTDEEEALATQVLEEYERLLTDRIFTQTQVTS